MADAEEGKMDGPGIKDPISRCLDAFGEAIGVGEREPWGYGTGINSDRISADVRIGRQPLDRQIFQIVISREWVKMEFDPSHVSLDQDSDLAKSIQEAVESKGWPSPDWKWDEDVPTVEDEKESGITVKPRLDLGKGHVGYEHGWQRTFADLTETVVDSYPDLVWSAESREDGPVLHLHREAPPDIQKLLDDFGTERGLSITVVVVGPGSFSVTDEERQRMLREAMGLPDPYAVQYGVVFTGPPTVIPHPKAEDHAYTLEEVCEAIRKAGYGGLRGMNGEWLCEP